MKLSDIQDIASGQKQALENQEPGLERTVLPDLPDIQSHALVVSGIRRCGKSTLLRQFVRKLDRPYFYLNFDDIRLAPFSHTDFRLLDMAIADSGAKLLFFDEIQSAEHWELYARQKLDEGFQLAITGTNASLLSRELGTRLNRDIAVRYGIRDTASLRRLFVYLVSNPTQPFSPSKLTGVAGVKSPTTVLEYISYFEAAYLIQLLPCFAWSVKAQSLAPKKVYVADTGIIKTSSVSFSNNLGALLENFVFNCLRTETGVPGSVNDRELFYFAGKNGGECDFVVSPHTNPSCIQVCWELTQDNQDREIQGLLEAMEFFNLDCGTIFTFNTEDLIQTAGKTIKVNPAWKT
jgi:predicted AAA+ superfamily ATPase